MNERQEWTKAGLNKELLDPKFRSKTVTLKTDYKREQNNLIKLKYEESEEEWDEMDEFEI